MPTSDLLSQEEIDALLNGVSSGDVQTAPSAETPGDVRIYDFTAQERIVRGRMPTLEMINERFARYMRISLFNMLRRSADISAGAVQMTKFAEYVHSLFVPTSLNLIHIKPLRGIALVVFDPKLVFILVDNFFGGEGRFHTKIEGRDFTPTELRVVRIVLDLIFKDLKEAWDPVMKVLFVYLSSEVNPQFANIVSPSEVVVISSFHVELDGGGGDFHITMPYSMLEPIRELLDAGTQSDREERDERWMIALRDEVQGAKVGIVSTLTEVILSVEELLHLRAGDVIQINMPETVLVKAEGIPIFRAHYGSQKEKVALKVVEFIKRPTSHILEANDLLDKEEKDATENKIREKIKEEEEKKKDDERKKEEEKKRKEEEKKRKEEEKKREEERKKKEDKEIENEPVKVIKKIKLKKRQITQTKPS
ncbi:flagellar motor switch protein FliM [Gammaproteobacteria bacterium]